MSVIPWIWPPGDRTFKKTAFMARVNGPVPFYGTKFGVCFYEMWNGNFVRKASSLTGEQVKKDPAFKATMEWAALLKNASRLGGAVYAMLPPYRRKHKLYRALTGQAMRLLKAGLSEGETVVELMLSIQWKKKRTARKITTPARETPASRVTKQSRPVSPLTRAIWRAAATKALFISPAPALWASPGRLASAVRRL